jgi:hypothetical protein
MSPPQGWVVEATAPIAAQTLICEYVGEVDFTRHHLFDGDDDIMDLVRAPHSAARCVETVGTFDILTAVFCIACNLCLRPSLEY